MGFSFLFSLLKLLLINKLYNLLEKEYQFATLEVLGFSDNKIKKIFI